MSALSYAHGASAVPLLGETIGANLARTVAAFPDREAACGYIAASIAHKYLAGRVPQFDGPLEATRVAAIFVAEKGP